MLHLELFGHGAGQVGQQLATGRHRGFGDQCRGGHQPQLIPGSELAEHPPVCANDHGRDDETAETRSVLADDDGGVAREHDAAHGVGRVVQVGRVQSRLTTVGPGPSRGWADEPDSGAVGPVIHLPPGGEELFDPILGEVLRCPVRAGDHPKRPAVGHGRQD